MKYLFQFSIILLVTFIGEVLHELLPLPVPTGIYGMALLFIALCTKVIKLEHVGDTADFLIEIMLPVEPMPTPSARNMIIRLVMR